MDAADWDARYGGAELVWSAEPNRWVVQELTDLPAGRALDLATGEGRNAIWLAGRGWRVSAVDFSAVGLERAASLEHARAAEGQAAGKQAAKGRAAVDWVLADVLSYVPPARSFDAVVVCYLHLPARERRPVIRRAAEALAPGGTLLVVGHDTTNLTEGVGGPQDARVLFTAADVVADLAGVPGLEVQKAERVDRPVPGATDGAVARDALVLVRRQP